LGRILIYNILKGKQRAQNSDIPLKDVRKAAMERDKVKKKWPIIQFK
jgi:hypothetical protein